MITLGLRLRENNLGKDIFDWTSDTLTSNNAGYIHFTHHVSRKDYRRWKKYQVWDVLKNNLRYGQSFCKEFDIHDNILCYERNQERADAYIQRTYLQRT